MPSTAPITEQSASPRLRVRGMSKSFGPTRALVDVDLDIHAGEVHALIGENGAGIRAGICASLEELGIALDRAANDEARGECRIEAPESKTQIWVIPTNEEWIVAKQTKALLEGAGEDATCSSPK